MGLVVVDPISLQDVFRKLEGRMVTVSSDDETNSIMRTFHKLEFHEDQLFYYFAETNEEYIAWKVSKHRVEKFEIDLDTIVLHMENGKEIIISNDQIVDTDVKTSIKLALVSKFALALNLSVFILIVFCL